MIDLSGWLEEGDWGKYRGRSKQGHIKVEGNGAQQPCHNLM